jgi:hypothetical protein
LVGVESKLLPMVVLVTVLILLVKMHFSSNDCVFLWQLLTEIAVGR